MKISAICPFRKKVLNCCLPATISNGAYITRPNVLSPCSSKLEKTPLAPLAPIFKSTGEGTKAGVAGANVIADKLYSNGAYLTQFSLEKDYPELADVIEKDVNYNGYKILWKLL